MKVQFLTSVMGSVLIPAGTIRDTKDLPEDKVKKWINNGVVKPVNVPEPKRKATKKPPRKAVV